MGQITVGKFTFKTKSKATEKTKEILNSATFGIPLTGESHEFMVGLIALHPRAADKIGCGIDNFTVNRNYMGGRGFYLNRMDGSTIDFSYPACISGKEESVQVIAKVVLRKAIEFQNWALRDSELSKGKVMCPYTGETITRDNYHVDHYDPKFKDLVSMWLTTNQLELKDIKVSDPEGKDPRHSMADVHQMLSWQTFHIDRSKRRLLSPKGNLMCK
jgi:hypothetical protein